ncbi:MAG: DUF1059 domain-containing protein, partial [Nitrososphaera sp.]
MLLFIANLYLPFDPGRSMKSLSCREAGCDCDYIAIGQTEEELMGKLREHGMKEH